MPADQVLRLSALAHTWVLDLDGTLVKHNGYKDGKDEWLPGVLEFLHSIPEHDFVMILTAREAGARPQTERFLAEGGVRYNHMFFEMPMGERILFNDTKPSGLKCAYAVSPKRNEGLHGFSLKISPDL